MLVPRGEDDVLTRVKRSDKWKQHGEEEAGEKAEWPPAGRERLCMYVCADAGAGRLRRKTVKCMYSGKRGRNIERYACRKRKGKKTRRCVCETRKKAIQTTGRKEKK